MSSPLWRRLAAEFLGTALLVTAVVGSGIMAMNLSPTDIGLQLLENSTATAFALTILILAFGPISGAHFNPVVSAADLGAYTLVQIGGAIGGCMLANAMFAVPVEMSTKHRTGVHLWLGETVATAGLLLLIFALVRTGRAAIAAPAVGAYIGAAYWFTSSTSFANPAVTIGRAFTDTFAGIAPASVPGFIVAQIVGLLIGIALIVVLYPAKNRATDAVILSSVDADAPAADGASPDGTCRRTGTSAMTPMPAYGHSSTT